MNRELKDFTVQISGGFASIKVERPLLSVICWSTATCEECKLAKVLLVPDPSLVCHPGQSVLKFPRRLSVSSGEQLNLYATISPLSEEGDKQKEVTKQEHSFVVVEEEREHTP